MKNFVKKYPAISMYIVASILGAGIIAGIAAGVLPEIFFLIAALSASLAGIILTAIVSGKAGLRKMFGRLLIWRAGIGWWIFAVFALGLMYLGGIVLAAIFTDTALEIPLAQPLYMFIPLLIMQFFFDSGLGEELGWRGFLLPRIQARYNALVSSIIVGTAWGLWHLPLFLVEGMFPYYEMGQAWGVVPSLLGLTLFITIPWAILFTWIYNNTKGSLLLAFVFHASQACFAILADPSNFINPYMGYMAIMSIIAIVVVFISGAKNLSRKHERITIQDA